MSAHATQTGYEAPADPDLRAAAREVTGYWWVWLLTGIVWITASLVILQFNNASITTVGVLIGLMFTFAGVQALAIASAPQTVPGAPASARVVSGLFSALFLVSAVICFIEPADTFAGLADVVGFLFLGVGVWWMIRAFMERPLNPLWWLTLISGILMTVLAFWTSGQLFIEKAYVLLVFAGIWALMEGVGDVIRAFAIRDLRNDL